MATAGSVDLDAVVAVARSAAPRSVGDPVLPEQAGRARIAVAGGPAFGFVYRDNLEALVAAGAELLPFDPLSDATLPAGTQALYVGGGFPEVYAAELASKGALLADVRARVDRGLVTWAECGGLLWLARSLGGTALAGVLPTAAETTSRLTLGFRTATARRDSPLASKGSVLRGHEFHYSTSDPPGDALALRWPRGRSLGGFATPRLLASYLHLHLGGDPSPASRFVATAGAEGVP